MTETETTDELMKATYAALRRHGYASLRVQDIADESSKSKATLHYHYESKRALLYALLDYLTDSVADRIETLEVVTVLNGAQTRHVAVDHPPKRTYEMLETYVSRQLLVEGNRSEVSAP